MKRCCTICDELRLVGRSRLAEALGDCRIHNAVLCSSRNYVIIPSIGPLAIGHALLVTRDHRKSIMHSTGTAQLLEIDQLLKTLFESEFQVGFRVADRWRDASLFRTRHDRDERC